MFISLDFTIKNTNHKNIRVYLLKTIDGSDDVRNLITGFGVMKSVKENCLYKGTYHDNKRQGQGMMIYP